MNIVLRFSRSFVLRYWPWYLAGMAALFATNYLTVLVPDLIQDSIDALSVHGDADAAVRSALHILPVAVGVIAVRTMSRLCFFNPGRAVEFNLKNRLFDHLQSLPQRYFDANPVGDLTSRCTNDVGYVRGLVGFAGLQIFNVLFAAPLTLWKMWTMSPQLTLFALIPMGLSFLVLWGSIRLLAVRMRQSLEQLSDLSDHILETFNAVPTIQGWNAMPAFNARYNTLNDRYTDNQVIISAVRAFMIPLTFLFAAVTLVGVVWFGGQRVIEGQLTVGVLAAFASYIMLLVGQFLMFGWTLNVFQRGYLSLRRIYEVLDADPVEPHTEDGPRPAPVAVDGGAAGYLLEVKDLSFAYNEGDGRARALSGVAFRVAPGETLGVFGPTGSGKTTLIHLLARVYTPPPGAIFINGIDVLKVALPALREVTALVPQDPFLFSRSLRENIAWGDSDGESQGALGDEGEDRPRVRAPVDEHLARSLRMACLAGDVDKFPEGVDTTVGARGITLSGGQRQRTALARAFHRPFEILLLDDVLSAVDHATEQTLIGHIYEAAEGQTTVLVAHRLSVLRHADRILVLDGGAVVDCGPHEALMARCDLYARTWRAQQSRERQATDGGEAEGGPPPQGAAPSGAEANPHG